MSTLALPKGIIEQLNKYLRHCFLEEIWYGREGPALISWNKVCMPKDKGGLGVLDLHLHNNCFLMKHLHKFFNSQDLPWVQLVWELYFEGKSLSNCRVGSFWWRDITKLIPTYKENSKCSARSGQTIMFWHGNWNTTPLRIAMPELFSFVLQQDISLKDFMDYEDISGLFHTPLSARAFHQFTQLQVLLNNVQLTD